MSVNSKLKFLKIFKNLKSDAVPRTRHSEENEVPDVEIIEETDESCDSGFSEKHQSEKLDPDDSQKKSNERKKAKKPFFATKDSKRKTKKTPLQKDVFENDDVQNRDCIVNTQATGSVINIIRSKGVHYGDKNIYYTNPSSKGNHSKDTHEESEREDHIEKCNLITLLMEAKIKPDNEYLDYISKNLGKNWCGFFRDIGFTKGRIETVQIDEYRYGVAEARYKLLLEWVRNDDDGSLGHLATLLWEAGERQIVKELAIIYKKNKK